MQTFYLKGHKTYGLKASLYTRNTYETYYTVSVHEDPDLNIVSVDVGHRPRPML